MVVVVVVGVVGVYGTHVLCGFNVRRRGNHVLRVHKRSKVHEPAFKGRHVMCVLSKSRVLKCEVFLVRLNASEQCKVLGFVPGDAGQRARMWRYSTHLQGLQLLLEAEHQLLWPGRCHVTE